MNSPSDLSFSLHEAQTSRKRFELMNRSLEARIAYLELEENKAQRVIRETSKQAAELAEARLKHQENQRKIAEVLYRKEEEKRLKLEKTKENKLISKEKALENKLAVIRKKQEKVLEARIFKEEAKKDGVAQKKKLEEANKSLILAEKAKKEAAKAKNSLKKAEISQKMTEELTQKLSGELERLHLEESRLLAFENKEKELMSKLKNTQNLQKQAYEGFEATFRAENTLKTP